MNVIENLNFILPPILEQTAIANFLDHKTAEIDQTIADKKQLINLFEEEKKALINEAVTKGLNPDVKFKSSGIDWLGDIPAHWEVKKLKRVSSKIGDGIHATPEYIDESEYYFINGNNLNEGNINISKNTKCVAKEEFEKYNLNLRFGTILISINGTIGNLAFYSGQEIVLGKSACYIEPLEVLYNSFLFYQLKTEFVFNSFETSLSGTTIKNLSLNTIINLKVLLPPLSEQTAIVNHIETETAKINSKIHLVKQEIELLSEYKKALIFEAVTGKIDVQEA